MMVWGAREYRIPIIPGFSRRINPVTQFRASHFRRSPVILYYIKLYYSSLFYSIMYWSSPTVPGPGHEAQRRGERLARADAGLPGRRPPSSKNPPQLQADIRTDLRGRRSKMGGSSFFAAEDRRLPRERLQRYCGYYFHRRRSCEKKHREMNSNIQQTRELAKILRILISSLA